MPTSAAVTLDMGDSFARLKSVVAMATDNVRLLLLLLMTMMMAMVQLLTVVAVVVIVVVPSVCATTAGLGISTPKLVNGTVTVVQ